MFVIVFMIEAMKFVLWISSGFWGKDPTVFSPVSTALWGIKFLLIFKKVLYFIDVLKTGKTVVMNFKNSHIKETGELLNLGTAWQSITAV